MFKINHFKKLISSSVYPLSPKLTEIANMTECQKDAAFMSCGNNQHPNHFDGLVQTLFALDQFHLTNTQN